MIKRRLERVAVTLLSVAMLLSSTGIASSLAANEISEPGSTTISSSSNNSTTVSQEGGVISSTTVIAEGGKLVSNENGNGTVSNPYRIANVSDLLDMQEKINLTSSGNKYFVLTSDIDLSTITAEDFTSNSVYPGSLVSLSKSLSNSSDNVKFTLDGNGHKLTGLNVKFASGENFSIFGYINSNSTIKNLVVDKCMVNVSTDANRASILASENHGTISSCKINYSVLSMKNVSEAGMIAAVNHGTISGVEIIGTQSNAGGATATSHTVSGCGTIGAVAGVNNGKITAVSVMNVGEYINASLTGKTVYGGIVGSNSGTVSNSFVSGNVTGGKKTDIAGGIAGSASKGATFVNNYVLVALHCNASANGIVGQGAGSDMLTDCYWSSGVSGRSFAIANYKSESYDIDTLSFKLVKLNNTVSVASSELSASWGKANFNINGEFTKSGTGILISSNSYSVEIKGIAANTVSYLGYSANITLPASVGNGKLSFTQHFNLPVITVSQNTDGNGTASDPVKVSSSTEFGMLKYAHGIHAKLAKNIAINTAPFDFDGVLDGLGHSITVSTPIFNTLSGRVNNTNIIVKSDISSAVFGKAFYANVDGVSINFVDAAKFVATGTNSGVMFSSVNGESGLNDCHVKANVSVKSDVTNFGALTGIVNGKNTVISNSGADVTVSSAAKITNAACVVGFVNATGVKFENCYASGKNSAGKYAFIASFGTNDTSVSNIYLSKGMQEAVDFSKYNFIDKSQFKEWLFDEGDVAFFTGNGGQFTINLPLIKAFLGSSADDYAISTDNSKLTAKIEVFDGKIILKVSRTSGTVTVKGCAITLENKKTGLSTVLNVSNGLEKDASGNYIVSSAYDLAYISENISELYNASFVMTSDIDMSVIHSFASIGGTTVPFGGSFNGNGHTVYNLTISGTSKTGLFAALNSAKISNIELSLAQINAKGSYTAVLAGQIVGNTVISNVTISNSTVTAGEIYSGILAGSIDFGSVMISDVTVSDCNIGSIANYVGSIAGHITSGGTVSNITVNKSSLSGAEFVGGVVGLADGSVKLSDVQVNGVSVKAVSEASGIAAGRKQASISNVTVENTEITTVSAAAPFIAGGIASSFGSNIETGKVSNVTVKAGIASAIVGKSVADHKLKITNIDVNRAKIVAELANSVAAGALAVHNTNSSVIISNVNIDSETEISSASIAAGVLGNINGKESILVSSNITSFAKVEVMASADAVAAAGLVGCVHSSSVNNIFMDNMKILGTVSSNASAGGLIGIVKGTNDYEGDSPIIRNSICSVQIVTDNANENCGVVIGSVDNHDIINSDNVDKALNNIVISTYFADVPAFGASTDIASKAIIDMDKPNGSPITASVGELKTTDETEVTVSNLPKVKGYSFDSSMGWISEAAERITVVSSSENSLVLKANHMADISIVGYYVLASDINVRIPIHFAMKSDVRTPLAGEGTNESPYLVKNAYDLESVAYYNSLGKYFALAEDINFTDKDFEFGGGFYNVGNGMITIGSAESGFNGTFTGLYNGKVHSVNGLKISGNTFGGIFGAIDGAVITDLIINNASVVGNNYAGIVVGNAKDSLIENITINNSSVATSDFGGISGGIVGNAENVTIKNIKINNSSVSTSLLATSATIENVGGIAGVLSGRVENAVMNGIKLESTSIVGGAVGTATAAEINQLYFNGSASADIAGGVIGLLSDPSGVSVSACLVSGSLNAEKIAAGIIGEVGANSGFISKIEKPLISDTVSTAFTDADTVAAVIGKADKETFPDNNGIKSDVFKNVYYSSYINENVFGTRELNSFQNSKFTATNLNELKFKADGSESNSIVFNGENITIGEDSFVLKAGKGNFKSFTLCGYDFELKNVKSDPDGAVIFNSDDSVLSVGGKLDGTKLVFEYSNGLELSIPVSYASVLSGAGTQSNPYLVGNADEFAIMMQNSDTANTYYKLTDDINLSGVKSAERFDGVLDGAGHLIYDYTGSSLFESVGGTVKNLGIAGFKVYSDSTVSLGALAGTLNGATIENSVIIANVAGSKKVQDAGIIAGRAIDGTAISGCLTSGKVFGADLLSAGGIVGNGNNCEISNSVSTAFVSSNGYVGGVIGEAERAYITNTAFCNSVTSNKDKSGNIAGKLSDDCSAENVKFDSMTATFKTAVGNGSQNGVSSMTTAELEKAYSSEFFAADGYAVPKMLKSSERSEKFATAVEFASMAVKYISGMNIGTALSHTDIKFPSQVNGNAVSVDKSNGLVITLMNNKDFSDLNNKIERFCDSGENNSTKINYSVVDKTGKLDGKLVGVLLKNKLDENSNSFSFFTKIGSEQKNINSISVAGNGIYADLSLPEGFGFTVKAFGSDGKQLKITDAENEGRFIKTDGSDSITLSFEITEAKTAWGIRSVWSVIGK